MIFETTGTHGYSVKYSPYSAFKIVVVTNQFYGLAGHGYIHILNTLSNGIIKETLKVEWPNNIYDVAWSPVNENIIVTCTGNGELQIWNFDNNSNLLQNFSEHICEVVALDWGVSAHQQFILSASWDKCIKVWDPTVKNSIGTYLEHLDLVHGAFWSPFSSSKFGSVSKDGYLKLWDTKKSNNSVLSIKSHDGEALCCDWSKYDENIIATCGSDSLIRCWDVRKLIHPVNQLRANNTPVKKVLFSPFYPDILASLSFDCSVKLYDFKNNVNTLEEICFGSKFLYGLDWSKFIKGQLVTCGWDSLVHIFKPKMFSYKL